MEASGSLVVYATLDELLARLDWEPYSDELRIALVLSDATELAVTDGREWPRNTVPRLVRAKRLLNPPPPIPSAPFRLGRWQTGWEIPGPASHGRHLRTAPPPSRSLSAPAEGMSLASGRLPRSRARRARALMG